MSDVSAGAAPVSAAPSVTAPVEGAPVDASALVDGAIDAIAEPAKVEPPKVSASQKKKYNLKIDGKDETMEFDPSNEDEIRKHLQLSKVSHKRMQEFADIRKNVQELLDTLRSDPMKVIGDPRLNIPEETRKKMAQSIIDNELAELQKTPEQKEKEKTQREFERLKKELEDTKKAQEEADMARLTQQHATELDNDISAAIEKSGLPKNARTVRYMAEALMFALNNNLDLSANDLVPYIKKQTLSEFKEMIGALPDDEFESWVGKDRLSNIRKKSVAKAKALVAGPNDIKPTGADAKKEADQPKKIHMKDFMRNLGR